MSTSTGFMRASSGCCRSGFAFGHGSATAGRGCRWLATAVLAGVIVQGVLGGLRVVLVKLDLAIVHGCVAQAFFCLCACVALVTSRWWTDAPDLSQSRELPAGNRVVRLAIVAVIVVYCQLIVGAVMRHEQAGLAIPDLPLAYGKVLPPLNQEALSAAQLRIAGGDPLHLANPPFTLAQVWLAFRAPGRCPCRLAYADALGV